MEFSKLSYKDLQKELKKRGMKASGKAVLLKRLRGVCETCRRRPKES